jgi:putative effector of murein hydrolase
VSANAKNLIVGILTGSLAGFITSALHAVHLRIDDEVVRLCLRHHVCFGRQMECGSAASGCPVGSSCREPLQLIYSGLGESNMPKP